ncbi:hypothetical protein MYIN104542_09395 [Mycobacterium intermedium]
MTLLIVPDGSFTSGHCASDSLTARLAVTG